MENDSKKEKGLDDISYHFAFIENIDVKREEVLYDRSVFDRLLTKTPLENYADDVWEVCIHLILASRRSIAREEADIQKYEDWIELTKTVLFLMENEGKEIEIKMYSVDNKATVKSKMRIDMLKNSLLSEFKNTVPSIWWTREACEKHTTHDFVKTTLELLIELLGMRGKGKNGAPSKNSSIAYLLKIILPYMTDGATNENFRLFYDICKIFKLIPEYITSDGAQYIKSIYDSYKKIYTEQFFYFRERDTND